MTKEMLNIQDYCDYMFPTSKKEVEALGWDYIDIIFFTGDAFVDQMPSWIIRPSGRRALLAGCRNPVTGLLWCLSLTGVMTYGISASWALPDCISP